jgi:hypothetical protein
LYDRSVPYGGSFRMINALIAFSFPARRTPAGRYGMDWRKPIMMPDCMRRESGRQWRRPRLIELRVVRHGRAEL